NTRGQFLAEIPYGRVVSTAGVRDAPFAGELQVTIAPASGAPPCSTTIRNGASRSCPTEPVCPFPLGSAGWADRATKSGSEPFESLHAATATAVSRHAATVMDFAT